MNFLQIQEDLMPFNYLGAPIFKSMPKPNYFKKKKFDRVCSQFARWGGKCLSTAGRAELVKDYNSRNDGPYNVNIQVAQESTSSVGYVLKKIHLYW